MNNKFNIIKISLFTILNSLNIHSKVNDSNFIKVNFFKSLNTAGTVTNLKLFNQHSNNWKTFINLYNSYLEANSNKNNINKFHIPRIIHQIWLGSKLPKRFLLLQKSWKKMHPNWKFILWTEKEIENLNLLNKKAYQKATNYGEKSDIARYEILYKFGGLYVDVDCECIKPLDYIHKTCKFYTGISHSLLGGLYNGLIGSEPKHPIIKECIDQIKPSKGDNNFERIMHTTGPYFFTKCFFNKVNQYKDKVVAFPCSYLYPMPPNKRHLDPLTLKNNYVKPETYTIQYHACSWQKK